MMTTLVMTRDVADRLAQLGALQVETGAVMLARAYPQGDKRRLLVNDMVEVPESAYRTRAADQLEVSSDGFVPPLSRAAESGLVPIWVHTHVGEHSSPRPSFKDRRVDELLAPVFTGRTDTDTYGSAIFSASADGKLSFTARLLIDGVSTDVHRLVVVGKGMQVELSAHEADEEVIPSMFDRNLRAFGGGIQRALSHIRVAVVGCGGTGSSVAEQLVRLGVRHLTLVDPDVIEESNVTRVYGSTPNDVDRPKVDVLADHLRTIQPRAVITRVQDMLTTEAVAREVATADLVFGCTDDNAGRMVLSRLATYMLQPVIDCGVIITSNPAGQMDGVYGRVTMMWPGTACLICRGRIDLQRAASEVLTPGERDRLAEEGYVPALDETNPAVVTYTTAVAAAATSELITLLLGGNPDSDATELLMRLHDREVSTNASSPNAGHYCDPASGKLGQGVQDPFLETTWQKLRRRIPWWRRFGLPWQRFRIDLVVDSADEVPERLPRKSAVLVGAPEHPKWVAFECPCRRGHQVLLNMSTTRQPYWCLTPDTKNLDLRPSVDDGSLAGRCHYFVRNGRISWAGYNVGTNG